jgi:2-polyprenyl-3-methyl-5-hydroxy-6-metoxy-1,4-benzoquinol methylase
MIEDRLFPEGTIPEWTKPEWHAKRDRAPHVDQPGHRPRLQVAAQMVHLVWEPEMTVVDLGAGDGGLLSLLDRVPVDRKWGYDLTSGNVAGATQRGQNVILGDCVDGVIEWGDVAVATEMLEHLVDPHGFVRRIADHSRFLVASSPWTETKQAHYEFHTWAWDVAGYAELLESNGWSILSHISVSWFQVVLAERL